MANAAAKIERREERVEVKKAGVSPVVTPMEKSGASVSPQASESEWDAMPAFLRRRAK